MFRFLTISCIVFSLSVCEVVFSDEIDVNLIVEKIVPQYDLLLNNREYGKLFESTKKALELCDINDPSGLYFYANFYTFLLYKGINDRALRDNGIKFYQLNGKDLEKFKRINFIAIEHINNANVYLLKNGKNLKQYEDICRKSALVALADFFENYVNIEFELGTDKATREGKMTLEHGANLLKKTKYLVKLTLIGHTDSQGDSDFNYQLSKKRAESIKSFLVSTGAPEDRIITEGRGEGEPIADNSTVAGRATNRRVEIMITLAH